MSVEGYWDFEPPLADEGWSLAEAGASTATRLAAAAWPERGATGLRTVIDSTSSAYVYTDLSMTLSPGQVYYCGFWFRVNAVGGGFMDIVRQNVTGGPAGSIGAFIYVWPDGDASIYARTDASTYGTASKESAVPVDGTWCYVVMAVKRATSAGAADGWCKLYVDGALMATSAAFDNYDQYANLTHLFMGSMIQKRDGAVCDYDEVKVCIDEYPEPFAAAPLTDYAEIRRTVLLTPDTSDGRDFAAYTVAQTGLPSANVCILPNTTATETLADYATFQTEVETDLAAWLALHPTVAARATTFLIGPGVPGAFLAGGVAHSATSRLMHYPAAFSSQTANPLHDPATVARLTVADLQAAGVYLASRIDADTLANAKAILDAGIAASALPATDVLYSDEAAYLATLPCQKLRIATAAIGELANDAFVWGDAGAPSFGAAGSRIAFVDDSADAADTLRATSELFDAMVTHGYAAGIGSADVAEAPDIEPFFEMLRIGGTLAEAAAVAAPTVDSSLVLAGDPLMTAAFSTTGYTVYRGLGDVSNVDFDTPVATLGAGESSASLTGLGHDASSRYTVVIRPVLNGLEGPDLSCAVEVVTDDEGEWIGSRPPAVERVDAEAGPAGDVTVRWTFRTPYGGSPPADFAVYRSTSRDAGSGEPEATETYSADGEYSHTFSLADGATGYFAVSARTAEGIESKLSPIVGPIVADASAPQTPTVYLSRTFT